MLAKPLRLQLLVVRTAMLLGVLLLGVIAWFRHRNGSIVAIDAATVRLLTYLCYGAIPATVALLFVLRKLAATAQPRGQMLLYLAGYGAAEVVAVLGGALWLFSGERVPYLLSLVLMASSFQVLPIPRE
jgi:hypothetical protein